MNSNSDLQTEEVVEQTSPADEPSLTAEKEETVQEPRKQRLFAHPFSFKGRIRRLEYGLSFIISYFGYVFIQIAFDEIARNAERMSLFAAILIYVLSVFFYIAVVLFFLAQGCKRCHDFNYRGWWQLIPFVPLVMLFVDGDPRENKYGPDPKGRNLPENVGDDE